MSPDHLDGATPEVHHAVRGAVGTFATTLRALRWAENAGLAVEVNTLITRRNASDLAAIVDLIRPVGIGRWNLYFLVPMTVSARTGVGDGGQHLRRRPAVRLPAPHGSCASSMPGRGRHRMTTAWPTVRRRWSSRSGG
jgi:hypothetical protein